MVQGLNSLLFVALILLTIVLLYFHHIGWWVYLVIFLTWTPGRMWGNLTAQHSLVGRRLFPPFHAAVMIAWILGVIAVFYVHHLAWWLYLLVGAWWYLTGLMEYADVQDGSEPMRP